MSLTSKEEFLSRHNKNQDKFEKGVCKWSELENIHDDYVEQIGELEKLAKYISDRYRSLSSVHSVRSRVKSPESLIEKIIRKTNKERDIKIGNYRSEITDLIGVRALLLYKQDWSHVAEFTKENWKIREGPIAYLRPGDPKEYYEQEGCEVKEHPNGYRSVHYILACKPGRKEVFVELQIRTLFEEAWSEIDHTFRYPYGAEDNLAGDLLEVLNQLVGAADEVARFLPSLLERIQKYEGEREEYEEEIDNLRQKVENLEDSAEKEDLLDSVSRLSESATTKALSDLLTLSRLGSTRDQSQSSFFNPRIGDTRVQTSTVSEMVKRAKKASESSDETENGSDVEDKYD